MIFHFGRYELDIDVDRTRAFYENAPLISEKCSCDGCRNYTRSVGLFPQAVKDLFSMLGADPKKCGGEVYVWTTEEEGRALWYGGFYHLCGTLLKGECKKPVEKGVSLDADAWYPVTGGYSVGFTAGADLLEDGFPAPVVQMEIDFHSVPWTIPLKNPY